MRHRMLGGAHHRRSKPIHRQVGVGADLPGGSGHIYTVPEQSVFERTCFHSRLGDFGPLRGLADDAQGIYNAGGHWRSARKTVIARRSLTASTTGVQHVRSEWR